MPPEPPLMDTTYLNCLVQWQGETAPWVAALQEALPWDYDLSRGAELQVGIRLLRVSDIAFTQRQVRGGSARVKSLKRWAYVDLQQKPLNHWNMCHKLSGME